jgi:hypothetical protein
MLPITTSTKRWSAVCISTKVSDAPETTSSGAPLGTDPSPGCEIACHERGVARDPKFGRRLRMQAIRHAATPSSLRVHNRLASCEGVSTINRNRCQASPEVVASGSTESTRVSPHHLHRRRAPQRAEDEGEGARLCRASREKDLPSPYRNTGVPGQSKQMRKPATQPTRARLAGEEGFEPSNGGSKVRCLTTWRLPSGTTILTAHRPKSRGLRAPTLPPRRAERAPRQSHAAPASPASPRGIRPEPRASGCVPPRRTRGTPSRDEVPQPSEPSRR